MIYLNRDKKGAALILVYMIIAVILSFAAIYFSRSFHEHRFSQRHKDTLRAYYAAEAGINAVAMDIYNEFISSHAQGNRNLITLNIFIQGYIAANLPLSNNIGDCRYRVMAPANVSPVTVRQEEILLKLIGTGVAPHMASTVNKTIAVTVSYGMSASPIFDYAYFINNFGWLWGAGITVNGDVRSNGNFNFRGNPMVNGDIHASLNPDLGATGSITGNSRNLNLSQYHSQSSAQARPTNPTDPANPDGTVYEAGYDGTSTRYPNQDVLEMPYLGDLNQYRQLAAARNGRITQGGNVLVDNVYNGNGPDGIAGTADDGSIILIGTAANPIVINGPVVVENDVIIRGVVSGQGTIYSGRNTHIIGNITYDDGPSWPKPDSTPQETAESNSTKDFLGLASKGNIVIGDYTRNDWQVNCGQYLRPPFTQSYETDITDVPLGYDSDNDPSNGYSFNGNYTGFDGGIKDDGTGGSTQRRYYESSLSDATIRSIAMSSNQIRNVNGVMYTNHAFAGKVGSFEINGTIVSRDEAIVYNGSIGINYDVRAFGTGIESIDIFLPRDLDLPQVDSLQSS
jgi:hypothetical protein